MVTCRNCVIACVVLLVGVLVALHFFPTEEKRIRKQFQLLAQYVSKEPGEDLFSMANRIQNIGQLFAEICEFKMEADPLYPFSGNHSREEVKGYALQGRSYFSDLTLKFHDLKAEFPERGTATVHVTGRLIGKSAGGEAVDEIRELGCILKKIDNKWLLSELEVVEVLRR